MRSVGITLNADTHSLLASTWFGRVIPADTIWNLEGVDGGDIREILALNGIDAGVQMPFSDYIQAVANALALDEEWMRNDVDSKSPDLGPDYDYDTAWCILDLMELESNAVIIV
jgi:hypothetical protein